MPYRTNLIYRYDGSFSGLLCCVFECFSRKELPEEVQAPEDLRETLYAVKEIETQPDKARRVEAGINQKIGSAAFVLARDAFLTDLENKDTLILRFLLLGFRHGAKVMAMTTREEVLLLDKATRRMYMEAHHLKGFLRFSDYGEFLAGTISPKNNLMPVLVPHFCSRFSSENFMIYDKVHKVGFVHPKGGKQQFFEAESIELPQATVEEERVRALWRYFYDNAAVPGRENPLQRRTMMPMRFWPEMTEFQEGPRTAREAAALAQEPGAQLLPEKLS